MHRVTQPPRKPKCDKTGLYLLLVPSQYESQMLHRKSQDLLPLLSPCLKHSITDITHTREMGAPHSKFAPYTPQSEIVLELANHKL